MSKPQSPELRRTGRNPALDPDNVATRLEAAPQPGSSGPHGPIPPDNRPGHRPERDQDQPEMSDFVARFRTAAAPGGESSEPGPDGERADDTDRSGRVRRGIGALRRTAARRRAVVLRHGATVRSAAARHAVRSRHRLAVRLHRVANVVDPE